MNKKLVSFLLLIVLCSVSARAYNVSTETQKRNVLIEAFVGTNEPNSPGAADLIAGLERNHECVNAISMYSGYYSVPYTDQIDLRTVDGNTIHDYFNISAYPEGFVSRLRYNDELMTHFSSWTAQTRIYSSEDAVVNLYATATGNQATREMTIHVEGYYTGVPQNATNYLCVALVQNDILSSLRYSSSIYDYTVHHVLRDYVSDVWGDEVAAAKGAYFSKDYTYTVPETTSLVDGTGKTSKYELKDLELVVYVLGDGKLDVLNAITIRPDFGIVDAPFKFNLKAPQIAVPQRYGFNHYEAQLCNKSLEVVTEATFAVEVNGNVYEGTWSGSIAPQSNADIIIRMPETYKIEDENEYTITLKTVNSKTVDCEDSLTGVFSAPIEVTPIIKWSIRTDNMVSDNTFCIRGADGNVVEKIGPFEQGVTATYNGTSVLEYGKTYCLEAGDVWGDGITHGNMQLFNEDGQEQMQKISITGFGSRIFFTTKSEKLAESVTLNKSELNINVDKSETLTATVLPEDTTDKLIWSSSNPTVATVDDNGNVTGVNAGNVTITATCGSVCAQCSVTVTNPYPYDFSAVNEDGVTIYYNIISKVDKTCEVTYRDSSYGCYSEVVNIPSEVSFLGQNYSVTTIGKSAFESCFVSSVTIPTSVTLIDHYAFERSWLESIIIPESVKIIGSSAFSSCKSLTSIEIPNSIKVIDSGVFSYCTSLTNVRIPNSVTSIGNSAFSNCSSLTTLEIPNSVTSIGEQAFSFCENLIEVTIPESVTSLGNLVFYLCPNIRSFYGKYASDDHRCLINNGKLIAFASNGLYEYSIPENVTHIGYRVFYNCAKLNSVIVPSSVISIEGNAFAGCSHLTSITLKNPVPVGLGINVFDEVYTQNCALFVPAGSKKAYSEAAVWKDFIIEELDPIQAESVTLNKSELNLNVDKSETLTATVLPEGASDIIIWSSSNPTVATVDENGNVTGVNAGNSTITATCGSVSAQCSVTVTNPYDFDFSVVNEDGVTIYYNIISEDDKTCEVTYTPNSRGGGTYSGIVNIPSSVIFNGATYSVIAIGQKAFSSCSGLTSVTIPNSVTSIGNSAFRGCGRLTSITIPNSVTSIGENAFGGCYSLTSITIPNSVTSLGYGVFTYCTSLSAFYGKFASEDGKYLIDNGVLKAVAPYGITNYKIPENITAIGKWTFSGSNLSSIEIPNSVTSIGDGAFRYCEGLTSITIPNSVTSIGDGAFYQSALSSIEIPNSVTSIGAYAFSECRSLTSIAIPNSVITIGEFAFMDCTLSSIEIPNSVTYIGNFAFSSCYKLSSITVKSAIPIALNNNQYVFEGVDLWNSTLYVPAGSKAAYQEAEVWKHFYIVELDPIQAESVTLSKNKLTLKAGESETLTVTVLPEDTTDKTITWSSSDRNVATVDENGNVTAVMAGFATITATCGSVSATCEVEVTTSPNKFQMDGVSSRAGKTILIPVNMYNEASIVSFNCDVELPAGLSLEKDEYGDYNITLADRCDATHVIVSADLEGKIRVVEYSSKNHPFTGNEGTIFYLPVVVSEDVEVGDELTIKITDICLTEEATFKELRSPDATATLTVLPSYTPGDVNDDGKFSAADVSLAVEFALGRTPAQGIIEAADVNGDGKVSSADISIIVSYILSGKVVGYAANKAASQEIAVERMTCSDSGLNRVKIGLTNAGNYTAAQFDVVLPQGASVEDVRLAANGGAHQVAFNEYKDGVVRVLVYSLSNASFSDGQDFIEIMLSGFSSGEMQIANASVVEKTGNSITEHAVEGCSVHASDLSKADMTSAEMTISVEGRNIIITSPESATVVISDLSGRYSVVKVEAGRNVFPVSAGIYFVDNKKIMIK